MNENTLIRRANLRALGLAPSELAERLGSSRQYWADLCRDTSGKSFGESTARRVEAGLGLPRNSLDYPGKLNARVTTPGQTADMGRSHIDNQDTKRNTAGQTIPTEVMFNPVNLSAAILLLGSLLGKMDPRSRRMMGVLLTDLAEAPDDAQDVADKAAGIAGRQKAVTSSKELDAAIQGKEGANVETRPAELR